MADISPSRIISVAGTDFTLDGSFATLRAVQESFKKDLYQLRADIIDMRVDQIALLIAIGIGEPRRHNEIGQFIIDNMDVADKSFSSDYIILKIEVLAWITVAMAPKVDREKKSAEMQAHLDKQKAISPILGQITSASPLAVSDGSPANSGEAISGN